MGNTTRKIIEEEIENYSKLISLENKKKILVKENNAVLDSLLKVDEYNCNNQIIEENWNWFKQTLIKVVDIPIFQHNSKTINSQLYAVKHYTNINFMIAESVEDEIKFELKKYFITLKVDDINEFINSFFELPFEFTSLVVRYVANVLIPEKKKLLVPSIKDAKENLEIINKKRDEIIQSINNISKGIDTNLSIVDVMLLLDIKAFFQDNPLNVGVLEFLARTIKYSGEKLFSTFGKAKIQLMLQQILTLPCYQKHLNEIAKNKANAYFTSKGMQNKEKEMSFDDLVTKYFNPEEYIPKPKQPEIQPIEEPQSEEKIEDKGELNAEQPSEEELMQQ